MLSVSDNTHRDKSLAGFSICCLRNSICADALDMLLNFSPKSRYVKSKRDLSHIELMRSGNISSSSKARTYRVNAVDISTEKTRARIEGLYPYVLALYACTMDFGLANSAFDRSNAMPVLKLIFLHCLLRRLLFFLLLHCRAFQYGPYFFRCESGIPHRRYIRRRTPFPR